MSSTESNAADPITLLFQAYFNQANTPQNSMSKVVVHLIKLSTHNIVVSDAVSAFLGLLRFQKRFLGKNPFILIEM